MGRKYEYDYVVIGSGPAGTAAALRLAESRKKIAIVEGRFFGGSNLNTRDIPYGVALDFSHYYNRGYSYPELSSQDIHFNFPTIVARQLKTVIESGGNNKDIFESKKITCIKGYANFLDKHTVAVGDKKVTSECFILATGAKLKTLEISGVNEVAHLTPETAIRLKRLPKVVAVVGAGSAGVEIAEYYAELGAKVILIETAGRILPREDVEVGETLSNYLSQKLGVTILTNSRVVAIEEDQISKRVIFRIGNSEKMVRVESIVLATGSQPRLDYGLENAGVRYKNAGIIVDKYFQTSAKNIYAVGDCIGGESSTDRALMQGATLASNLIDKSKTLVNYQGLVRTTKTMPEVAVVGLDEDDLLMRDRKYKKAVIGLDKIPASKIYSFNYGFVKLIASKSNKLIGAVVVAPDAELMISELALAVRHNLSILELASVPHSKNSFNYAIKLAAKELLNKK